MLVAYTLYRNDGSIKATAEELDTSEKTVQRTVKKIKEKQVQLKDTFEQYITQDPKEFLADLHRVAFKQLTGQESPTSLN